MHASSRCIKLHHGFTLIELLVVISIISILISILLPALGKARQSAKAMGCLNQLRTIGQAVHMYANDNDDYVPGWLNSLTNTSANYRWVSVLMPYTVKAMPWVCTNAPERALSQHIQTIETRKDPTDLNLQSATSAVQTIGINAYKYPSEKAFDTSSHRIGNIPFASSLIYAGDCTGSQSNFYTVTNTNTQRLVLGMIYPTTGSSFYPHHSGGIQMLFVDSHASRIPEDEARLWSDGRETTHRNRWLVNP
jgi:prepilin-type N-terminal cleavage/methylation domain-containing protein/prepilin-type processing-associated H-X9-DG protein